MRKRETQVRRARTSKTSSFVASPVLKNTLNDHTNPFIRVSLARIRLDRVEEDET